MSAFRIFGISLAVTTVALVAGYAHDPVPCREGAEQAGGKRHAGGIEIDDIARHGNEIGAQISQ